MVGPDGDADDVLVAGAEHHRHQQEEKEQGTRAPAASDRLQEIKKYGRWNEMLKDRCMKKADGSNCY